MNYYLLMEIIDHCGQNMGNIGKQTCLCYLFNCKFCFALISSFCRFVPKERWLHNIEHGAIIMLYDPCVLQSEVEKLRNIVRSCIKKHVITPTTFLSPEKVCTNISMSIHKFVCFSFILLLSFQPMALITWGCRLEFSYVDEEEIKEFIKTKGKTKEP